MVINFIMSKLKSGSDPNTYFVPNMIYTGGGFRKRTRPVSVLADNFSVQFAASLSYSATSGKQPDNIPVLGLLAAVPGTVRCRLPLCSRFPTRSQLISIVFFLVLGPVHPKFVPACRSKRSRADSLARPIPTASLIVTTKPVDCGLVLLSFGARPFSCLSVHILSARMLFMACRKMSHGTRWMHYLKQLSSANVPAALIEKGQNRVIDASLTLIRERAKLKVTTAEKMSPASVLLAKLVICSFGICHKDFESGGHWSLNW